MCPNRCGASFERDDLEDHLKMCGLEKILCDFSYAGCEAEFMRNNHKEHMEQNTQKHLALLAAATLRISQAFKRRLQEQQKVFERKLGEQRREFILQLERKDKEIEALKEQNVLIESNINKLNINLSIPPYKFTATDYQRKKASDKWYFSPCVCTHSSGYRIKLRVDFNGWEEGEGTHVSVSVFIYNSDHDDKLKFPAKFTIFLELLNQHRDQDHYKQKIDCKLEERIKSGEMKCGSCNKFISHADLELNEDTQTQYLKNDCLKFKISKILTVQ